MLLNIFCGCTSNKNIQNDVIELDIKDDINIEEKEPELELLEKKGEQIETSKKTEELDIKTEDQIKILEQIETKEEIKKNSEEYEEIIDILTEKPIEKTEESKTTSRKFLFF
jgi:hypothetical protein